MWGAPDSSGIRPLSWNTGVIYTPSPPILKTLIPSPHSTIITQNMSDESKPQCHEASVPVKLYTNASSENRSTPPLARRGSTTQHTPSLLCTSATTLPRNLPPAQPVVTTPPFLRTLNILLTNFYNPRPLSRPLSHWLLHPPPMHFTHYAAHMCPCSRCSQQS